MKKSDLKNTQHYVDNAEFYQALKVYHADVQTALTKNEEKPLVPNYIGECFVKIANHLAYKSNFINYTYRDEMILDAIENCITYIDNFDPTKSSNPFAYFTQISYYAFVRRIIREMKHQDTKNRYIKNLNIHEIIKQEQDETEYVNEFINYLKKQVEQAEDIEFIEKSNYKRRPKYLNKKKAVKNNLDIPNGVV